MPDLKRLLTMTALLAVTLAGTARASATYDLRGHWEGQAVANGTSYANTEDVTSMDLSSGAFSGTGTSSTEQGTETGASYTEHIQSTSTSYTSDAQGSASVSNGALVRSGTFHDSNGNSGTFQLTRMTRPAATQVTCAAGATPSSDYTCTAQVSDATAQPGGALPAGTVQFSSSSAGSSFPGGSSCTLSPSSGGGSAACSVTWAPPAGGVAAGSPVPVTGAYGGDSEYQPASGSAGPATGGSGGGATTPSAMQVICTYRYATFDFLCTAQVADRAGSGRIPTGNVSFTASSGGFNGLGFCTLRPPSAGAVASCSVVYDPPANGIPAGTPPPVTAAYGGDGTFSPTTARPGLFGVPSSGVPGVPPVAGNPGPGAPGTANVQVTCPLGVACSPTTVVVTPSSAGVPGPSSAGAKVRRRARVVILGRVTVALRAHRSRRVVVRLNRRGLARLHAAHGRRLRVRVTVIASRRVIRTARVAIRAPRPRRHHG